MRRIHTAGAPSPDMTPMMDIVFIMLIFFIVTASFIRESGVEPNYPKGTPPRVPENKSAIGFLITAQNQLMYEGYRVDIWRAEAIIKQRHVETPELPVVIKLLEGAKHGQMIRLYDAAFKAGVPGKQIAILTEK